MAFQSLDVSTVHAHKTHKYRPREQEPLLPTLVARHLVEVGASGRSGSESCWVRRTLGHHLPCNVALSAHQIVRLGYGLEPCLSHLRRVFPGDGGIWVVDTNEVKVYAEKRLSNHSIDRAESTDIALLSAAEWPTWTGEKFGAAVDFGG